MQEVNEINNYIKFFDLIVNTKKKYGKNWYYIQNVETLRRDLDAQYEYKDKNKDIEELKNVFDGIKKLDQVKNKLLDEFNKKYSTNIKLDDEKIDLTGKNIKNEGLRQFCRINLENIKELIITKNDITSIKCLYEANLYNLEILKADQTRINSIEILPYLKCFKLKKLILNDNKLCNIETLGKLLEFNSLELIDLSNNYFDQKLESNQKIIYDLQQMIKIVKINEEENGTHENDITDEELNELMN
jgi:Leucine-rich repeat (LRR) protein